jgi:glycosyltransferase involved in cell wall biosynthesis
MNKNPTVSIIIPTYNRAHLVGRAIQSILDQTYKDFELIIVDDGSTDNTENIIREFQKKDKRIKYICHKKNRGGSAARNTGVKNSSGYFLSFLDSDDQWLANKLRTEVKILNNNKDCIICSTGYTYIDEKNGKMNNKIRRGIIIKKQFVSQKIVLRAECFATTDFTVTRNAILKIGGFDEKLSARQDWDFWIRITSIGLGIQIPIYSVIHYTMRNDQISSGIKNKLQGTEILYKKHKNIFLLDPIAHRRILNNLGLMNLLNGSNFNAVAYFWESYKYTNKWSKRVKLAVIIAIIKIFGVYGSKAIASYYKFKNPNSYLLW